MKTWQTLLTGVLIGLLAAGAIMLIATPIKGHPVKLLPAPTTTPVATGVPTSTPEPIVVQIDGKVQQPGLYALPVDARLGDLISLAGGLKGSADTTRINLAALCADGDYFYIPAVDESIPETAKNAPQNIYLASTPGITYPLDLNQATQEQLESLPGIGPGKAADIIAYRESHGLFSSLDDLLLVDGIGSKTLELICEFLIIEP